MNSTQHTGGVEATLREMWATRPVRPRSGAKLAGVSAAIGRRYGIDPILVRVAFVVAFFYGGAGLALYLLGWLLLPKEIDPLPGETTARREPTRTWVAVILLFLLIPSVLVMTQSMAVLGLAAGLLALYFLHVNQGHRQVTGTSNAPPQATPTGENTWVYPGVTAQAAPDPAEWRAPEPPAPPERRFRWYNAFALIGVVVGTAIVASLGAPAHIQLAVALGLLGAAMFLGAFLKAGRWPVLLAVPLAVLALITSAVDQYEPSDMTVGELRIAPVEVGELAPRYGRSAGTIDLDLSQLRIGTGQRVSTTTDVGAGRIGVRVPSTADVHLTCAADFGEIDCLDRRFNGQDVQQTFTDHGPDGPGGGDIVLTLTAGTGQVEVTRD